MICPKCKNRLDETSAEINGYRCPVCGKLTKFTEQTIHCLERPKIKRPLLPSKKKEEEPEMNLFFLDVVVEYTQRKKQSKRKLEKIFNFRRVRK
jgi:PHP family Zn ribbon phosphoesterase